MKLSPVQYLLLLPLQLALQVGLQAVQLLQRSRLGSLHSSSLALQRRGAAVQGGLARRQVGCSCGLLLLLLLQGCSCGLQRVAL